MFSKIIRFYRLHLSRYLVIRVAFAFLMVLYRCFYRACCFWMPNARIEHCDLVPVGSYIGAHLVERRPVFPAQNMQISAPAFLNYHKGPVSATPHKLSIQLPKIDVLELSDVAVVGGSDFILAGKAVLAPDIFVESADTCPSNVFGVTSINHSQKKVSFFLSDRFRSIEKGISLIGQNTANYAHWLTEILPKLTLLKAYPQYNDFPLLVDRGLNRNIYESISIACGMQRQLIYIKRWEPVSVSRLLHVSQTAYEPYIPNNISNNSTSHIVNSFSAPCLSALRDAVMDKAPKLHGHECEKIFLCRSDYSHNLRGLSNSSEIEKLMQEKGFNRIDPAKLSFIEQAQVCSSAKIIVAPIGASLANMIFAPTGCQIIALAPYYKSANYFFYSNLAELLKIRLNYILGKQLNNGLHPMHRSYSIDLIFLERIVDSLISHPLKRG